MAKLGLVAMVINYGGVLAFIGYICTLFLLVFILLVWELKQIGNQTLKIEEGEVASTQFSVSNLILNPKGAIPTKSGLFY